MNEDKGATQEKAGRLESAIFSIGPAEDQVVRLDLSDGVTSRNFEYADLLKGDEFGRRVSAVIEKDGSPLVYIADIPQGSPEVGKRLAQLLGNRGETAVLLDIHRSPGKQTIAARAWPCMLDAETHLQLDLGNPVDARSILGDLQEGLWGSDSNAYQEQRLRNLLVDSVETVSSAFLKATAGKRRDLGSGQEVLALVGRALFTRFLLDRGILSEKTAPALWGSMGTDGELAFSSASQAAAICLWLDQTFNGEFMPLSARKGYQAYFEDLLRRAPTALEPLGWIVGRTDVGGQLPLWEKLDFSHIPAGTLSEVYEDYAHRKAPRTAKKTSVHFTPRHVARTMVRQALAGLPPEKVAYAKILDPAVGAAVFLSLSFRELARHRAISDDGVWPDTKKLRDILYGQLRGMDLNSDALNLAALTLYLTAIELDANPVPPEKLKFDRRLIGSVLHDVGIKDPHDSHAARLGSLRKNSVVGVGIFDAIIGNPPWTSMGLGDGPDGEDSEEESTASDALVREVESIAAACIEARGVKVGGRYAHPDKVPDLAFLWKATQWAKPGGIISLLVHQRLLIKQSTQWKLARQALFSSIEIDGILNAGEFANHDQLIWPGIESPFCIVFARNNVPPKDHRTVLLTLAVEPTLLRRRQIRIDPMATMSVTIAEFDEHPGGMVVRTKGCELDRALLQRWAARVALPKDKPLDTQNHRRLPLTTIGACVDQIAEKKPKRGFKTGLKKTKLPEWYKDLPAQAKELAGKSEERIAGEINASDIHLNFIHRPVRSSPTLEWYTPPILLIRQAAGKLGDLERTALITPSANQTPVLYPFAFLGTPLKNTAEALLYAKYIAVWVNSSIFSYYQTLTSTQLSFGIKTLINEEILETPALDPRKALQAQLTNKKEIESLFAQLARPSGSSQADIDAWAFKILGMDENEMRLVEDTLSVAYPIGKPRQSGKTWVSVTQVERYLNELRRELSQVEDAVDVQSLQLVSTGDSLSGWRFVTWRLAGPMAKGQVDIKLEKIDEDSLLQLVRDKYPEGEVWAAAAKGQFVFGQLALNRLWLPSRACLVAQVMVAWADQAAE
ncbi:MAG: N-6 DNA methylase [Polaromonas sp.]|uniref:HsdM family class I SAM-dependent methyltransferase n=1 Tax=Polaromonas sp. TaxID=1869339 RepID=UPI003267ED9D